MKLPGRRRAGRDQDPDRVSLAKLAAVGANLGKPRRLVHELMYDGEDEARAAADRAERAGWDASIETPTETQAAWIVRAASTRVVDETTVVAFRAHFERLAEETGGTYLGWEAASKP